MQPTTDSGLGLVSVILIAFGVVLIASAVMAVWVIFRVGRIELPPGTGFWKTLRATPLSVVILLDLMDFALDFLSAPAAWVLLTWLGLGPLRWVAVIEGLLPFTHLIPTMTLAWILARLGASE